LRVAFAWSIPISAPILEPIPGGGASKDDEHAVCRDDGFAGALKGRAGISGNPSEVAAALKEQNYRIVHFGFDADLLDRTARRKLDRPAAFIRRNPDIVFAVVGHTDKVGNPAYNEALGMRRAMRVVTYLVSRGVGRDQLRAMTRRGEDQPVIATLDAERPNRRVETGV
jgi:outer membrane protein OmpA-like peptidoglycan-associated protein